LVGNMSNPKNVHAITRVMEKCPNSYIEYDGNNVQFVKSHSINTQSPHIGKMSNQKHRAVVREKRDSLTNMINHEGEMHDCI
jgi:hypothetical protein